MQPVPQDLLEEYVPPTSCSPIAKSADPLGLVFHSVLWRHSCRPGAHTATAHWGAGWARMNKPQMRTFYAKFLTLSKIAYTRFYAMPLFRRD